MDKKEYYKISQEKGLPARCPILNYCQRRGFTLYFFGEYKNFDEMLHDGTLPEDFDEKRIMFRGEEPGWGKGENIITADNICPEVNLFDSFNALPAVCGTACSTLHWDKLCKPEITKNVQTHYSECAEFSYYSYHRPDSLFKKIFSPPFYSMVYQAGDSGFYKMGVTDDPDSLLPEIPDHLKLSVQVYKKEHPTREAADDYINELKEKLGKIYPGKELHKLSAEEIEKLINSSKKKKT